jgi:hypothetical protein
LALQIHICFIKIDRRYERVASRWLPAIGYFRRCIANGDHNKKTVDDVKLSAFFRGEQLLAFATISENWFLRWAPVGVTEFKRHPAVNDGYALAALAGT